MRAAAKENARSRSGLDGVAAVGVSGVERGGGPRGLMTAGWRSRSAHSQLAGPARDAKRMAVATATPQIAIGIGIAIRFHSDQLARAAGIAGSDEGLAAKFAGPPAGNSAGFNSGSGA
jgi:hypothetical protein